jgi:hypothetical protein
VNPEFIAAIGVEGTKSTDMEDADSGSTDGSPSIKKAQTWSSGAQLWMTQSAGALGDGFDPIDP